MNPAPIGSWILDSVIAETDMSTVYLARHRALATRRAVIKALHPALTNRETFRDRFFQEAQTQAALEHPHIVHILDFVEQDGQFYMVMEYQDGGDVWERITRAGGPLPLETCIPWAEQALDALDFAHRHRVIHRDVKPANLLLDGAGRVKVTDFGIALVVGGPRLTQGGMSIGTPHYMSPEQIQRPQGVDHRTDVYSMGIVLYEMVTGRVPFDDASEYNIRRAHVSDPPPPPRSFAPIVPDTLERIILKALEKDPDRRFRGCHEFSEALASAAYTTESGPPDVQEETDTAIGEGPDPEPDDRPDTLIEDDRPDPGDNQGEVGPTVDPGPPPPDDLPPGQDEKGGPSRGRWTKPLIAASALLVVVVVTLLAYFLSTRRPESAPLSLPSNQPGNEPAGPPPRSSPASELGPSATPPHPNPTVDVPPPAPTPSPVPPLIQAAYRGDSQQVTQLLAQGEDANQKSLLPVPPDRSFGSPLGAASGAGHMEVVRLLVERGKAKVNGTEVGKGGADSGRTALMEAAEAGHLEIARYLIRAGAGVDLADAEGKTALHYAARRGNAELVRLLLNMGAKPLAETRKGETPKQVARDAGQRGDFLKLFDFVPPCAEVLGKSAVIGNASAIFSDLDQGEDILWPSPEAKRLGGTGGWGTFRPGAGDRGVVVAASRFKAGAQIVYILKIGENYVPVRRYGVRVE